MKQVIRRSAGVTAAVALAAFVAVGCSDDNNDDAANASASISAGVDAAQSAAADATDAAKSGAADATDSAKDAAGKVELTAADGSKVELTGPIAAKFKAATEKQKTDLGAPMTGDDASGTSDSGVVFQQFKGGVITAKNGDAGTPAFVTWGKIRDAWNVKRDDSGKPSEDGKGGSNGPLGAATSDETDNGGMKESTFENGKITFDAKTGKVEVTVKDQVVPTN